MKFVYIGDCEAGGVTLYGVEFPAGKPVEVTDEALIQKLQSNNHFEAVKLGADKSRSKKPRLN